MTQPYAFLASWNNIINAAIDVPCVMWSLLVTDWTATSLCWGAPWWCTPTLMTWARGGTNCPPLPATQEVRSLLCLCECLSDCVSPYVCASTWGVYICGLAVSCPISWARCSSRRVTVEFLFTNSIWFSFFLQVALRVVKSSLFERRGRRATAAASANSELTRVSHVAYFWFVLNEELVVRLHVHSTNTVIRNVEYLDRANQWTMIPYWCVAACS
jgi:hypothetical protein